MPSPWPLTVIYQHSIRAPPLLGAARTLLENSPLWWEIFFNHCISPSFRQSMEKKTVEVIVIGDELITRWSETVLPIVVDHQWTHSNNIAKSSGCHRLSIDINSRWSLVEGPSSSIIWSCIAYFMQWFFFWETPTIAPWPGAALSASWLEDSDVTKSEIASDASLETCAHHRSCFFWDLPNDPPGFCEPKIMFSWSQLSVSDCLFPISINPVFFFKNWGGWL